MFSVIQELLFLGEKRVCVCFLSLRLPQTILILGLQKDNCQHLGERLFLADLFTGSHLIRDIGGFELSDFSICICSNQSEAQSTVYLVQPP